jgi:hypothetical protein
MDAAVDKQLRQQTQIADKDFEHLLCSPFLGMRARLPAKFHGAIALGGERGLRSLQSLRHLPFRLPSRATS